MSPRLHVVLRSYGGENQKNRPPYYSKLLALTSLVRASLQVSDIDLIFFNDGPIPPERLSLMERYGTVVQIPGGPVGMRRSYWKAVTLSDQHPEWGDDDLVMLCEDDYLFRKNAFSVLLDGAGNLPEAQYFSVYGAKPDYDAPRVREEFSLPHGWKAAPDRIISGARWFNQPGVTSTFAGRVSAMRNDRAVFRHCMIPFRNRFLDHETCLMYQGYVPYRGWDVVMGLPGDFVPGLRGVLRTLVLIPFRVAMNLHATLRTKRHLLYCVSPNEGTHLEYPVVSRDHDWLTESRSVVDWAHAEGFQGVADVLEESLKNVSDETRLPHG